MSDKPGFYLQDLPLDQARKLFQDALEAKGLWGILGSEAIHIEEALDRVTSQPVWAKRSVPHYHAAAMDGYAIRAEQTVGASDRTPIDLIIGQEAVYLDTGDEMPVWADGVIPIELPEPLGVTEEGRALEKIRIRSPITPWAHVRPMGEDVVTSELVFPAGSRLRPVDLGAIAGSGTTEVIVTRKPKVAILPTGSELVPPGTTPEPGQILDFNSLILRGQVETWGGVPTILDIVPDDLSLIENQVRNVMNHFDILLIIAGSSAGLEDYTAKVVSNLGTLLVHGIAVRPGHPVILGLIGSAAHDNPTPLPVIGVPGYPVSAALTGELFVRPLLHLWQGIPLPDPDHLTCKMTRKVHSSLGDDEFLRVAVGKVASSWVATPLSRGAGVLSSLTRADGLVTIPSGTQGLEQGELVPVELYRTRTELERTIVFLGSHDLTLDLISQFLGDRGYRLSYGNVGSLGGLIALRRGEAHIAGCHLWDPKRNRFNIPYIQEYLPNTPVQVISLVNREQGLIVHRSNPKAITKLEDLTRPGVRFTNRQRGSGTRILLDSYLSDLGIDSRNIEGYDREEITHMAVAASIASGRVDCGLGIRAAAEALELDFIHLFDERYDLVFPVDFLELAGVKALLQVLRNERLKEQIAGIAGYDPSPMGVLVGQHP
jgi:putative molybdopterin biosynthesis protein